MASSVVAISRVRRLKRLDHRIQGVTAAREDKRTGNQYGAMTVVYLASLKYQNPKRHIEKFREPISCLDSKIGARFFPRDMPIRLVCLYMTWPQSELARNEPKFPLSEITSSRPKLRTHNTTSSTASSPHSTDHAIRSL